jgi:CBS-domain-containing membrane protein
VAETVSRREAQFDAMLRHLGAAYYQTLRGEASAADMTRAVEAVTEFQARGNRGTEVGGSGQGGALGAAGRGLRRRGQWRVRDVMTTDVVTAGRNMSYKQTARLMTSQRVSAIPVVAKGGRVVGLVSEADVLRKAERRSWRWGNGLSGRARRDRVKARARTAGELMTYPVITIRTDAPLSAAARLMNAHHIRRLPVVNAAGDLIGIVSRRDLMKVFLRPDQEITAEVNEALGQILLEDARQVAVCVRDGLVTLTGALGHEDLIPVAVGLASGVAGVVAVINRLTRQEAHNG